MSRAKMPVPRVGQRIRYVTRDGIVAIGTVWAVPGRAPRRGRRAAAQPDDSPRLPAGSCWVRALDGWAYVIRQGSEYRLAEPPPGLAAGPMATQHEAAPVESQMELGA